MSDHDIQNFEERKEAALDKQMCVVWDARKARGLLGQWIVVEEKWKTRTQQEVLGEGRKAEVPVFM